MTVAGYIGNPHMTMSKGTSITCTLDSAIDTEQSGFGLCLTDYPVKSMDGRNVAYSEITINIHARFVGDVGVAALQLAYAIPSMWVDTPSPGPASRSVATPRH